MIDTGMESSNRPLIGITCGAFGNEPPKFGQNQAYVRAIDAAGGVPILVPPMSDDAALVLLSRLDGILFTGGPDVDPRLYGQANNGSQEPDPGRDATELVLARAAAADRVPVLGICRGQQLINVALNGTLIQDMAGHNQKEDGRAREEITHSVEIVERSSALAKIAAGSLEIPVNSLHHQVVDRLGEGLKVTARSSGDGHIEGFESEDGSIVAVQCHPEHLTDHPWARELFRELVERAAARSKAPP